MNRFKKWQTLDQYFKQGVFSFIDLAFAESVLKQLNSDEQEHAALLATLFALSRQGHLTLDLSKESLESTLQILSTPDRIPSSVKNEVFNRTWYESLSQLLHDGAATFPLQGIIDVERSDANAWICRRGTYYYLQRNWVYETEILKHLERLNTHLPAIPLSFSNIDSRLNLAQKKGIENAMKYSLSLLTGGPGTGKTFTATELVKACLHCFPLDRQLRIILTAPTGKAVSQLEGNLKEGLSSQVSIRAGTLHALLGIKSHLYEEEKVAALFADLIIVDECSMIDAKIFSQLLACIPVGARLILIGDQDQLPPIEAGSIFADLLEADAFPSSHLTECLRSDRKEILTLSHHIKQGNADAAFQSLNHEGIAVDSSIHWIPLEENKRVPVQVCGNLWEQYHDRFTAHCLQKPLPEQIFNSFGHFALLSSMRQGPLGVDAINRYFLYQSLKKVPQGSWWLAPFMITRNDYELGVYNGDLGVLVRKITDHFSLRQFDLDDYALLSDRKGGFKQIAALNLPSFEYSYCLSVHKSQGSEYDEACILIPPGSESFGREVLYTAVTRARHKVTLMCHKEVFLKTMTSSSRKTSGLVSRLRSCYIPK